MLELTKAVIIGNKALCGKCGGLLFYLKNLDGYVRLEIKCKHREQRKNCLEINLVEIESSQNVLME